MASSGLAIQLVIGGGNKNFGVAGVQQHSTTQAAGAAVAATATMPATAGKTNWLTAYQFWVGLAAAGGSIFPTIAGLLSNLVTDSLVWTTTTGDRVIVQLPEPQPASGTNVAITATVPSSGASGPPIGVDLWGFQL